MKVSDIYRSMIGDVLFHFTPAANLQEIGKHMTIYSSNNLSYLNITPTHMSNDISREADKRRGISAYVFLVFRSDHPLIYKQKRNGLDLRSIPIDVSILDLSGVAISDRVANDSNANFYTPEDALKMLKIQYCHDDYISDYAIWDEVKKYEILIPNSIDINTYIAR